MRAPVLATLESAPRGLKGRSFDSKVRLFRVVESGAFGGQRWSAGQVLVCRGTPRTGDAVVLVARGHGRPRMGRVQGTRFIGDAGEPCHPARWGAAGRVVGAFRRQRGAWVADTVSPSAVGEAGESSPAATQLRLFAA